MSVLRLVFCCVLLAPTLFALPVTEGPWVGGVTSYEAVIVAKLSTPRFCNIDVSLDRDFARSTTFAEVRTDPGTPAEMARFRVSGLKPNSVYYYRLRAGRDLDVHNDGSFRTLPVAGELASFRFAFGSCARSDSEGGAFLEIKYQEPAFFLHTGDLHYDNIGENDPGAFRNAYARVLASKTQGALYRHIPLVYMWDDHDFGANNASRLSASRPAAQMVYREYVPHYPLPADEALAAQPVEDRPVSQAFSVGRARFIVLDCRSQRDPADTVDGPDKTMLGPWQKEWLKKELLAAQATHPLIFIVSSVSWISDDKNSGDNWGRYAHERAELADWMVGQGIRGVCFLGGDAHMLAADDGTHNTYAANGGPGFPALQAAPLDNTGSIKGGPWSVTPQTPADNEGQFGIVTVTDQGDRIDVLFQGMTDSGREKMRFAFSVPGSP